MNNFDHNENNEMDVHPIKSETMEGNKSETESTLDEALQREEFFNSDTIENNAVANDTSSTEEAILPEDCNTANETIQNESFICTDETIEKTTSIDDASLIEETVAVEEGSIIDETAQNDAFMNAEGTIEKTRLNETSLTDETITAEGSTSTNEKVETTAEEPTGANTNKEKKIKKPQHFVKRHRTSLILSGCFLLAVVGGFGGNMLANQFGSNRAVLYQNVEKNSSANPTSSKDSKSVKDVAKEAADSVVEIKTESVSNGDFFREAVTSGAGSGVILSKDGYIVTNNHVISGANKITVTTKNGKSYEAKLVGTDSSTDLAVLKIEATNLTPAIMGSSSKLEVGDTAIAIGNPLGELGGTVTSGIISALDRAITVDNQTMHLLQTNAAINPGNSGGGLFNDNGDLVGIVNAKSSGTGVEGLGFAIPIDRAKDIIENLIQNGYVKGRASLGVSLAEGGDSTYSNSDKTPVYVAEVVKNKAADKAGIKPGDQVLKVDGKTVSGLSDVKTAVNSHKAGEKMTMVVLRDGETKTITVTLGEADTTNSSSSNNNNSESDDQSNIFGN